ncbi:MAG: dCTP deaminase [Chloroflexota bacterium]|nr:dCTP deaminase [Chloroflexota bacterium]
MVLSNVEVLAEIRARRLVFDPPIDDEDRFDSSSVDLLLDERLLVLPDSAEREVFDSELHGRDVMGFLQDRGQYHYLNSDGPYTMPSNRLLIGQTLEFITLPDHLAARIEGKSSLARVGLSVHVTAPTVKAGFEGRLVLEMNNIGPFPIVLRPGMPIAQLILEHVGLPPSEGYQGQYQGQR